MTLGRSLASRCGHGCTGWLHVSSDFHYPKIPHMPHPLVFFVCGLSALKRDLRVAAISIARTYDPFLRVHMIQICMHMRLYGPGRRHKTMEKNNILSPILNRQNLCITPARPHVLADRSSAASLSIVGSLFLTHHIITNFICAYVFAGNIVTGVRGAEKV